MSFIIGTAKQDVYRICQSGQSVTFKASATTDEYGEPLTTSTQAMKAFPVRYQPFSRTVLNNISWANDVDSIAFISKKEFDNNSLTLKEFQNKYKRITVYGKEFDIKYIESYMAHADDFLYVVVGCKR